MPEVISCPQCDRKLQVPESLLGQDVQCPTCDAQFVASLGKQTSPSSAPPSAPSELPPVESPPHPPAPPERYRYQPEVSADVRPPPLDDEYSEDYDDYDYDRRRRMRRRDLLPHRGVLILVMGILGLVFMSVYGIGLIFGIIAWVMGNADMQQIRSGRMDPEGEGLTQAGRICGIISSIMGLLCCGGIIVYLLFIFGLMASGAGGM